MCPSSAEPRRLVVVVDRWATPGGGLEAYLQAVLPALAQSTEWEIILMAEGASVDTPTGCFAQDLPKPIWPRPKADRSLAKEVLRRLARLRPDVVWNLRHLPIPGAFHLPMGGVGIEVEAARGRTLSRRRRKLLEMEQEAMQQASHLLPSSPKVGRELTQHGCQASQTLLPLPMLQPVTTLATAPEAEQELRVVACGRDAARHGAEAAVRWWLAMRAFGHQGRLDLWGKSVIHLQREIGESSLALAALGIHLHGWDGLFAHGVRQAHLLFHPTLYDSFSLVCLEAAAHGVPVVTTPGAGVAELLPTTLCAQVSRSDAQAAAEAATALCQSWFGLSESSRRVQVSELQQRFALQTHLQELQRLFSAAPAWAMAD